VYEIFITEFGPGQPIQQSSVLGTITYDWDYDHKAILPLAYRRGI